MAPPPTSFTVKFGSVARTLEYKDSHGELVFTFDYDSQSERSLLLKHHSARQQRRVPRYSIGFDRAKQYMESCGYRIEVSGAVDASTPITALEVTDRIQAELRGCSRTIRTHLDFNQCLIVPQLLWFREAPSLAPTWDLWLVFEESPATHDGWRIVFDEFSGGFGVADGDLFGGFEGTFIQTLEAISRFP